MARRIAALLALAVWAGAVLAEETPAGDPTTAAAAQPPAAAPKEDAATAEQERIENFSRFVVGRYDLIGRHPDGGKLYSGRARIDLVGAHLRLTREIDGWRGEVFGTVRRADPGEALVLNFAWNTDPAMEMVCLIGSDLDNYARLTCHWGRAGNPHKKPGMEAYFAQEPWDPVR